MKFSSLFPNIPICHRCYETRTRELKMSMKFSSYFLICRFVTKWLIISKKPWFTGIQAGFQAEFTTNLLLLRERALICRPEPCQPSHQHTALRKNKWKLNTTHTRRFSIPTRENRNAAFFMPSCYAVGAKRALLYAALRAHFCRGQGFIPLSPKMPFYCVTFQYLHQWESGVRWLYDSCRVPVFSNCRDYYILPNVLIVLLFHYIFVHFPNHQYPHVFWTHNHQYFLYP